jgi:hypothetical protein
MLAIDIRHDLAGSLARRAGGRVSRVRGADRLAHAAGGRDTRSPQAGCHARILRSQANVRQLHDALV